MNWKGCEGSSRGLIHGTLSWFASRDLRKPQEISAKIACILTEIRERFLSDSFQNVTAMRPLAAVFCTVSRSASVGMADNQSLRLLHAIHMGIAIS